MSAAAVQIAPEERRTDVDRSLEELILVASSRVIGTMNGRRVGIYKLCAMLAFMARLPFPTRTGIEPPIAADLELAVHTAENVLKRHRWTPAYLDQRWNEAEVLMGVYAGLPEIADAFIPKELQAVLAVLAALGPAEAHARLVAAIRAYALRDATSGARIGEPVGAGTLGALYTPVRRFMKVLHELHGGGYTAPEHSAAAEALAKWTFMPPSIKAGSLSLADNGGRVPRYPPTEELLRLGLARQFDLLPLRYRANGTLLDRTAFKPFRDVGLAGLVCAGGPREGSLFLRPDGPIRVCDWEPAHHFDRTNYTGPALRIVIAKKGSEETQATKGYISFWLAVPPEVAQALETYLDIVGTRHLPDAPLWIKEWANKERTIPNLDDPLDVRAFDDIVAKAFDGRVLRGGYKFAPHDIRHTNEPALAGIGRLWFRGDLGLPAALPLPTDTESIAYDGQVIADAVTGHSYRGLDPNGYKHCEDNRERFALVGVFGMWELLRGDLGATRGPDLERRMHADQRYAEFEAELAGCESRIAALTAQIRSVIRQMAGKAGNGDGANRMQAQKWELEEDRLLETARKQSAEIRLSAAREELEAAYKARVPLPSNWLPDRTEDELIRLDEAAIRTHRRLQTIYWHIEEGRLPFVRRGRRYEVTIAALRAAGLFASGEQEPAAEAHPDVSPHLSDSGNDKTDDVPVGARLPLQLAARIFMKDIATLKRWARGKTSFRAGDPRNPWQPNVDPTQPPECIEGAFGDKNKHVIVTPQLALWLRRHPEIRERFALALAGRL
jgi:hypothetical protein